MNEFELERELSREEIAAYLRKLADGLERDDKVTFVVGDESATMNPPDHAHVRMETNTDSSWLGGDDGQSFFFEMGWEATEAEGDQELTIITQPRSTGTRGEESTTTLEDAEKLGDPDTLDTSERSEGSVTTDQ